MGANDQLLQMLKTIDETESYLRSQCKSGLAVQMTILFEDLSSLIALIHTRFQDSGLLPKVAPIFYSEGNVELLPVFLDKVVKWKSDIRERIKQKEMLSELSRGTLFDAIAVEGKPFVETAKAMMAVSKNLRAEKNELTAKKNTTTHEVQQNDATLSLESHEVKIGVAGAEMARKSFAAALKKSPAATALENISGNISQDPRNSDTLPESTDAESIEPYKDLKKPLTIKASREDVLPSKSARPMSDANNDNKEVLKTLQKEESTGARPMGSARQMKIEEEIKPESFTRPMPIPPTAETRKESPARQMRVNRADNSEKVQDDTTTTNVRQMSNPAESTPEKTEERETTSKKNETNEFIRNETDRAFYVLADECAKISKDAVIQRMKRMFQDLESRYKMVITDYTRRFSYWGALVPDNGIFTLFENRAQQLVEHADDIRWLYGRLSDYRSRKTLLAILNCWYSFNFKELSNLKEKAFDPYFDLDIFKCDVNEVYVDLGAYIGETVESFIRNYGRYRFIYCYEMTEQSYVSLNENTSRFSRIKLYQLGVSDKKGTSCIGANGGDPSTNKLSDDSGATIVDTVTLDEHLPEAATFIKMNLEGGEQAAIRGATQSIKKMHPKLAIRADHTNEDLWKIAKMISEIDPSYKLYLRHYGGNLVPAEYAILAV